jgi:hypothetical protein
MGHIAFRGREPSIAALLNERGLTLAQAAALTPSPVTTLLAAIRRYALEIGKSRRS